MIATSDPIRPSLSTGLFALVGFLDRQEDLWEMGSIAEANMLLSRHHYLGPVNAGGSELVVVGSRQGEMHSAQVWRLPTARNLPNDGTWLELSRWCLTPSSGENAGSRQHRYATRIIRDRLPMVTTLVSYSDPSHGHTGSLYRACNWTWAPTWHRLRTPPTGNGSWARGEPQAVKDRWIFSIKADAHRDEIVNIYDTAAIRYWIENGTQVERQWAASNPQLAAALAVSA